MNLQKIKENKDYRSYIGPGDLYNKIGKIIFDLLVELGLEKYSYFLDVGCGSLRMGKLLIPFLWKSRYYGIEPEDWLIQEAVKNELSENIIEKKSPLFSHNNDFDLGVFERKFDFILANSIFIHAGKKEVSKCIKEAFENLKKDGKFLFSFIPGKDNEKNNWSYPGAVKYSRIFIENELIQNGFAFNYVKCDYPGKQVFILAGKNG